MEATELRIGSKVIYEDMANPRRIGYICDVETTKWGVQYVIAWQGGRISTSDVVSVAGD